MAKQLVLGALAFACLLAALAALLASPAEASKWFVRKDKWEKRSDCRSLYGDYCKRCCNYFSREPIMKGTLVKLCYCEGAKID